MTWTTRDIPDQTGRTAVVTGANSGLGLETARALSARGAHVVMACRDEARGRAAAAEVGGSTDVVRLDLASLESVREAAAAIHERYPRLDLLIANAGIMITPQGTTADGFEQQFGTNHLGHFALTGLLIDRMLAVPGSRIVVVSSNAHRMGRQRILFEDLHWTRGYHRMGAYAQSKLANLMFMYELQRRLAGSGAPTAALAAHPGFATTNLARHVPGFAQSLTTALGRIIGQDAAAGALPTLRAATDPAAHGGQFYGPSGFQQMRGAPVAVASSEASHDESAQRELWRVSEELTGVGYDLPVA